VAVSACCLALSFMHPPARAQGAVEVSLWYRSSVGCPSAEAFVARLSAREVAARLAEVGDTIDFVVTLGEGADGRSRGVLERQAATGTVALRQVQDESCEQVADALALSLSLSILHSQPTLQPAAENEHAADAGTIGEIVAVVPARAQQAPLPTQPAGIPARKPAPTPSRVASRSWWLGLEGTATSGVVPGLLPGGSLFVALDLRGRTWLHSALRLSASGRYGSGTSRARDFRVAIWSADLEGCPVVLGSPRVRLQPCAGMQLGQISTEGNGTGGRDDQGIWAAATANSRLVWQVGPVALEALLGLAMPLIRYSLVAAGTGAPERTARVGAQLAVGAAVQLP